MGFFKIGYRPYQLWCRCAESNRGPIDYESIALPTELQRHENILVPFPFSFNRFAYAD